jgi:hypothetical protein
MCKTRKPYGRRNKFIKCFVGNTEGWRHFEDFGAGEMVTLKM